MELLEIGLTAVRVLLAGFLVWGGLLCLSGAEWISMPKISSAARAIALAWRRSARRRARASGAG